MCKTIILTLAAVAACTLVVVSAAAGDYQTCLADSGEYIKAFKVDSSVKKLTDEIPKFYPNIDDLVRQGPSKEFNQAMVKIGSQAGCPLLIDYMSQIRDKVPCFKNGLDTPGGLLDLINLDQDVKHVMVSYWACLSAESKQ